MLSIVNTATCNAVGAGLAVDETDGFREADDIEKKLGTAILEQRNNRAMFRTQLASILGLKESGLRRHEIGKTKLSVSRLIYICEALGTNPVETLAHAAPHLFGVTDEAAAHVVSITKIVSRLDEKSVASILAVVQHFEK